MDKPDRMTPDGDGSRASRSRYWFPLVLFGLIQLASLPLYRVKERGFVTVSLNDVTRGTTLFWILALPVGYIATAIFYRKSIKSRGSLLPFIAAGAALFAALVIAMPEVARALHLPRFLATITTRIPNLLTRGLTPLLVIAIGMVLLAFIERSSRLAVIATAFLAMAITANLYDMSNVFQRLHFVVPDWATNLSVTGGFLVAAGLMSAIAPRVKGAPVRSAIATN